MNILQGIILGILQGLTEFLPVSSSGHLVLFQNIMGIDSSNMLFFNVMVHVGTLIAIFVVFWKDIVSLLRHPVQKLMGLLIVATIPAVIAELLIGDFIESTFGGQYLGVGFLLTAVLLTLSEMLSAQKRHQLCQCGGHWVYAGCGCVPGHFAQRLDAGRQPFHGAGPRPCGQVFLPDVHPGYFGVDCSGGL